MRTLDRYIIRSFLFSALVWFLVLMSLRIVVDLAVEMDEFTERDLPFSELAGNIARYYGYNALVYFAELGGIIIVTSAAFTLAMMNHTNELTAMMASGVSLHRVAWPIIIISILLGGLIVIDREMLIPKVADKLVRSKDDIPGQTDPPIRLANDSSGSVWYSPRYYIEQESMTKPVVVLRERVLMEAEEHWLALAKVVAEEARPASLDGQPGWMFRDASLGKLSSEGTLWRLYPDTDRIHSMLSPESIARTSQAGAVDESYGLRIRGTLATDGSDTGDRPRWMLLAPRFEFRSERGKVLGVFLADAAVWGPDDEGLHVWRLTNGRLFLPSDLDANELALRRSSQWLAFCSTRKLIHLMGLPRFKNTRAAELTRHTRVTEPINNLLMLLLGLPFILSRERNIKASAGLCLLICGSFLAFIYVCRYMGLPSAWAAWLPTVLFGPVAAVMFDSVRT